MNFIISALIRFMLLFHLLLYYLFSVRILIGMLLGLIFGFIMLQFDWGAGFVDDWIKPIGTIFVKLLKLIAIPLILASLIKGISDNLSGQVRS